MTRNRSLGLADLDPIELADLADRPTRSELAGPADGCDSSPWCQCWDCERLTVVARTEADIEDYGMGEW